MKPKATLHMSRKYGKCPGNLDTSTGPGYENHLKRLGFAKPCLHKAIFHLGILRGDIPGLVGCGFYTSQLVNPLPGTGEEN